MTAEPRRRTLGGLLAFASLAALIVAGAALAVALSRGSGSDHGQAGPGAGLLPTAPASAAPLTTPGSTGGTRAQTAAPGTWPVGLTAFTVVLATLAKRDHPRALVDRLARSLRVPGLTARVLDSSRHPRLRPSVWIVYVGRYATRGPADRLARQLRAAGSRRGVVERLTG